MTGSEEEKKRKRDKPARESEKRVKQEEEGFETVSNDQVFTLYVFGFPYETDIADYCKDVSPVAVRVHTWHDSGKSKGCAHLDFDTEEARTRAISELNGKTVGSRYISATVANELASGSEPANKEPAKRLFVKNLPYEMSEQDLKQLFGGRFGEVQSVRIPHWNHTGKAKGFGYVEFIDLETAQKCMEYHATKPLSLQGRRLVLDYDGGAPKRGFKTETGRAWYKA